MEPVRTYLKKWNTQTDSLTKIQGAYAVIAITLLLLGGLVSLVQSSLGQMIAFYAIIAGLTFVANGVIWALIKTFVVPRLEEPKLIAPKSVARKK